MSRELPSNVGWRAIAAVLPPLLLGGCFGPDLEEGATLDPKAVDNPARTAAIGEIRSEAANAGTASSGFPFVFDNPVKTAGTVKSSDEIRTTEADLASAARKALGRVPASERAELEAEAARLHAIGDTHVAETEKVILGSTPASE
ncbi:hypothetical protein [Propylenella binzhouense]|uniref:Uncharacterized protein n=1 Tax=Propylenella binzhouense TaxID=2555902 RepID=A0A964WTX6_9HYPH|nr:hypothetical protein [Propylenella binzhouense]MYZ48502.1 hypothetical protein [Propylenella binzhouense]